MKNEAGIFQKVELGGPDGDCWEWQSTLNNRGYGTVVIHYPDSKPKNWLVHRLAYKLSHPDEDISDKLICHKCDNRRCCNPDHLFSGTAKDNMQDCVRKGRYHKNGKLTQEERDAVKELYATGEYTMEELGKVFNVSSAAISYLVHS